MSGIQTIVLKETTLGGQYLLINGEVHPCSAKGLFGSSCEDAFREAFGHNAAHYELVAATMGCTDQICTTRYVFK